MESATVLERLHAMGCDEAQGWHIGKPMPSAEWGGWPQQRLAATAPA